MTPLSRLFSMGLLAASLVGAANFPAPVEGDYIAKNFKFVTGETLPELRIHYFTVGTPQKDASGRTTNAVLIMHGTGGSGRAFTSEGFGGHLFGPGQTLDATKYFIIMPDGIGHGKSSKPSDGLHMKFPKFTYDDMVKADYLMITEGLGLNHLRLVMGTSMGAMHTWIWGEMYPDFMDALMPLASNPTEIAGRNWALRQEIINLIEQDPDWNGGEYTKPPIHGIIAAEYLLGVMTSCPLCMQKQYPTHAAVVKMVDSIPARAARVDANDMIYQYDCSRLYNPEPNLEKIKAPLIAINSADDQVNPPELGISERLIKRVKNGKFILLPISDETRGHGTHSMPAIWGKYLDELMKESEKSGS